MTHGHELRGRDAGGRGGAGQRGIKGRKKQDKCNSIINKIYKKTKTKNKIYNYKFINSKILFLLSSFSHQAISHFYTLLHGLFLLRESGRVLGLNKNI